MRAIGRLARRQNAVRPKPRLFSTSSIPRARAIYRFGKGDLSNLSGEGFTEIMTPEKLKSPPKNWANIYSGWMQNFVLTGTIFALQWISLSHQDHAGFFCLCASCNLTLMSAIQMMEKRGVGARMNMVSSECRTAERYARQPGAFNSQPVLLNYFHTNLHAILGRSPGARAKYVFLKSATSACRPR